MKTAHLLLAACLALSGCEPLPNPPRPPTPPTPVVDAGPQRDAFTPTSGSSCAQACAVLVWLGCEEGLPTARGQSCESVCYSVESFPGFSLPTTCVTVARSIDAARACGVKCGATK